MTTSNQCKTCDEYVTRRLPTVLRLWWKETGQRVWIGRFMTGVHKRHEAGLPVLTTTDAGTCLGDNEGASDA